MRASNRSHWQHNDNVGFHLKNAATLSNQWGPLLSLPCEYQSLFRASDRCIVLVEYYNPTPTEVFYRGHSGKLFKRDFAGELLDMYQDLRVIDYGFVWHRDPEFPQDDLTWFVLEKTD